MSIACVRGEYYVQLAAQLGINDEAVDPGSYTLIVMILHIIYTDAEIILSKKSYDSWREIQDEYSDFRASLGPWPSDEVAEYLSDEYSDIEPAAFLQVADFLQSTATIYNVKLLTKKDD